MPEILEAPPSTPVPQPNYEDQLNQLRQDLALKERQYNGLQGSFANEKKQREAAQQQLDSLIATSESKVADAKNQLEAIAREKDQALQEAQNLKNAKALADSELEASRLILAKFPDLAAHYGQGLIRTSGLTGADLETFLQQWQTNLTQLGEIGNQKRVAGSVPQAPTPAAGAKLSLEEVQEKKMQAMRQPGGTNSQAYREYAAMEDELIRQRPYRQPPQAAPRL